MSAELFLVSALGDGQAGRVRYDGDALACAASLYLKVFTSWKCMPLLFSWNPWAIVLRLRLSFISCGSTADAGWRCCSVFVGFRAEVPSQSEKVDSIIEAS